MGEKSRITVAFLPAVAIHALLITAIGALLVLGIEKRSRILPVAFLDDPEKPEVEVPVLTPAPSPQIPAPRSKKKKVRVTAQIPEPAEIEAAQPSPAEQDPAEPAVKEPAPPPPAPAPAPAPKPAPPEPDLTATLSAIRAKLQKNLVYPPVARLNRIQGTVELRFAINSDGNPSAIKVVDSSGFDVLDQAAIKTVQKSAPLPVVPVKVKVPVIFELD